MAKLFIPNPENKRCVNHKNWNRQDNRVSNLEWVTHAENSQHSIHLFKRGDDHYNAKLTAEDVMQIRIRHRFGECSLEIAKDFQMHPFNIYLIINRKTWKHVA